MDDQAAAWKSIAMNAIGEEPLGGGDDGLMLPGGDWLAASINSREIPGDNREWVVQRLATGQKDVARSWPNRLSTIVSSSNNINRSQISRPTTLSSPWGS